MKLFVKKTLIWLLLIAIVVSSLSVAYAIELDDGNVNNDALKGSVSIMGVHKDATVKWQHIIVPSSFALTDEGYNNTGRNMDKNLAEDRANVRTGWIFYPNYEQYNTNSNSLSKSPLMCFADAYGFSLEDYNLGHIEVYSNSLSKEDKLKLIDFEQDVMEAFIDDYAGRLSDNNSSDGNTPSNAIHSSSQFQQALKNLVDRGVLSKSLTDPDGFVTIRSNLHRMNIDTGMYVMLPENDMTNGILYSPTAAFVNFRYANGTGDDQSGDVEGIENVVAHAKSTKLGVEKTVANGDYSYTVGDIVEFNIKSTYPTLAPEMYASSVFKFEDSSCDVLVEKLDDVVVMIGNTTLRRGIDYILEIGVDTGTGNHVAVHGNEKKFVVTLLDGDGTNSVANYNPDFAGKEIVISYKARVINMWKWVNSNYPNREYFYEIWNEAKVIFDSYSKTETIKAYPVSFRLQKTDAASSKALTGAVFVARKLSDPEGTYIKFKYDENKYKVDGTTTNINEAKITINNTNGELIIGLDGDETYVFSEIQAPVGYSLSDSKIYVGTTKPLDAKPKDVFVQLEKWSGANTFTDGYRLQYKINGQVYVNKTFTFSNTSLMALPSTGGWGTYAFTIIGVAAIATAVIIVKNRKDKELDAEI